jgi:Calcineurin-like phosphoesterase
LLLPDTVARSAAATWRALGAQRSQNGALFARAALLVCLSSACAHDPAPTPSGDQTHAVESNPEARSERPVHRIGPPREEGAPPRHFLPPRPVLSPKLTRPPRPLIIAIGDLHGDLDASRRALRLAGAIDDADHWSGGALTVVQTGDVLDRGDEDRELSDLLLRLRAEALAAGGELITLSGNHELFNAMLTFDYVTPGGFSSFGGRAQRAEAFRPGGPYSARLAEQPIVMMVGDNVFVHGGILPEHVHYGLDRMNDEAQAFMRGELPGAPSSLVDASGLLWTRLYSSAPDSAACAELGIALAGLHARRMVVGHTPQLDGISSACDERVFCIDTGMSRFYLGGPVEVLEIQGDTVRVLRENAPPSAPRVAP